MRNLFDMFKAFRRGDRRVAPRGVRGRIYERKRAPEDSGVRGRALKSVTIRPRRVFRAATGEWENITE